MRRGAPACRRRVQTALDAANRVERFLVGGGVLHNQFRLAVDSEDFRPPAAFEAAQMRPRVALKIRQRADVFDSNNNIEFNVLTMLR